MYETLKPLYPEGTCNRTDPIVRHESPYKGDLIITKYFPQYDIDNGAINGMIEDGVHADGIYYPLIRINNRLLSEEQIVRFALHNDRFMPYLDLVFNDYYDTLEFSDMPGLNNVIAIVLMENIPDAHKPIKMNFYATSIVKDGSIFYVEAEFKCLELEKERFKQEVFYWPDTGCKGQWCQLPANFHPTTYEFLHVIADNCGLGFSATQQTLEVKDDRYRILKRQKYKDLAQTAVECGGITGDNMFDSWIDPWGNLVMANVSWIMNEDVHPDELATSAIVGVPTSDAMGEQAKKNAGMVHRILSNAMPQATLNNMIITNIQRLVDLNSGYYEGTLTDYHTVYPEGANKPNNGGYQDKTEICLQQIQEEESSLPGAKVEEYEFHSHQFAGFDMAELTQTVEQRQRHKEYFKKLRSHIFKVTMEQPNFGLERGMLCIVNWYVSDADQKAIVNQWSENLTDSPKDGIHHNMTNESITDTANEYVSLLDYSVSGMYYIDGTEWEWDQDNARIIQYLYLIKKDDLTEYYNKEIPGRLS